MVVVLKGAIKTHSYVRFDHLRYARRDGGVVLVAVAAARRRRSRCQFYIQLLYKLHVRIWILLSGMFGSTGKNFFSFFC